MKEEEKSKARKLRYKGWAITKIAKELNVSKGSVSVWVRDIKLSNIQREALNKNKTNLFASASNVDKYRNIRLGYQKDGAIKAKDNDHNHKAMCMLYWAE